MAKKINKQDKSNNNNNKGERNYKNMVRFLKSTESYKPTSSKGKG